jgi:hypothetical protein
VHGHVSTWPQGRRIRLLVRDLRSRKHLLVAGVHQEEQCPDEGLMMRKHALLSLGLWRATIIQIYPKRKRPEIECINDVDRDPGSRRAQSIEQQGRQCLLRLKILSSAPGRIVLRRRGSHNISTPSLRTVESAGSSANICDEFIKHRGFGG